MQNIIFLVLRRMRAPLVVLLCAYAISVVGFTLIPGVDNAGQPWRMDFFHAFYFVSFMGSTIGFGEIPYPFTGAQRLWTTFSIYATVISWLYAIGTLISLMQNPALRQAVTYSSFTRRVRRIAEPFYLVCGCGDTGKLLIHALALRNIRVVTMDIDKDRINDLELEDLDISVPALCGDATDSEFLIAAGLNHPCCAAVVALTRNDEANLKIAIASKLLNPKLPVICRAQTHDVEDNMASFGTDHIINPFDTFADHLAMALTKPGMLLLHDWLTSAPNTPLTEPIFPPQGRWVLCGFGRFGKAVGDRLNRTGCETTIVELSPDITDAPVDVIVGRGTEADTLQEAGISSAVGIIAGTDNDANNLSIVMTADHLKPELFMVARQNRSRNSDMFRLAKLDLITHHSGIIASRIRAIITTPLTSEFLAQTANQSEQWANRLISRICGVVEHHVPYTWVVHINEQSSPAVVEALQQFDSVRIDTLYRDSTDRKRYLQCIGLLIKRHGEIRLLPSHKETLRHGDQILFCGHERAARRMRLLVTDPISLTYTITGKHLPTGWFWRWLEQRRKTAAESA